MVSSFNCRTMIISSDWLLQTNRSMPIVRCISPWPKRISVNTRSLPKRTTNGNGRRSIAFVLHRSLNSHRRPAQHWTIVSCKSSNSNSKGEKSSFLLKNVLVTGRSGSGKKTIVNECCQHLWTKHLIYYRLVDCLAFKGNFTTITLSFLWDDD